MDDASTGVPLVDLTPWFSGTAEERAELAAAVDRNLQRVGFLVVTGHGVPAELVAEVRRAGLDFFRQPEVNKSAYSSQVGGRGWLAIGAEANGYSEGTETPPDLKESFIVGAEDPTREGPDATRAEPPLCPARIAN